MKISADYTLYSFSNMDEIAIRFSDLKKEDIELLVKMNTAILNAMKDCIEDEYNPGVRMFAKLFSEFSEAVETFERETKGEDHE